MLPSMPNGGHATDIDLMKEKKVNSVLKVNSNDSHVISSPGAMIVVVEIVHVFQSRPVEEMTINV